MAGNQYIPQSQVQQYHNSPPHRKKQKLPQIVSAAETILIILGLMYVGSVFLVLLVDFSGMFAIRFMWFLLALGLIVGISYFLVIIGLRNLEESARKTAIGLSLLGIVFVISFLLLLFNYSQGGFQGTFGYIFAFLGTICFLIPIISHILVIIILLLPNTSYLFKHKALRESSSGFLTYSDEETDPNQPQANGLKCGTCNQYLHYMNQYKKWYCYTCRKYL